MRFAMEELKIALCTILKDFRFFPVEETPVMDKVKEFMEIAEAYDKLFLRWRLKSTTDSRL